MGTGTGDANGQQFASASRFSGHGNRIVPTGAAHPASGFAGVSSFDQYFLFGTHQRRLLGVRDFLLNLQQNP